MIRESSPSETAISESSLNTKSLCDYVVNVADGCHHGCSFCYVPSMPMIWGDPGDKFSDAGIPDPVDDWGEYALYRDQVVRSTADDLDRLLPDQWRETPRGRGIVGISFGTDCYMDPRAAGLTLGVVKALIGHNRRVRILTRNPRLLWDLHGDFYKALPRELVSIGTSIPALDQGVVGALEPDAPGVKQRLLGMEHEGFRRFVSMSPTPPTMTHQDVKRVLRELALVIGPEVVFHEPINLRGKNLDKCIRAAESNDQHELARGLERFHDRDNWREYALGQLMTVQKAAMQVGQRVHLWPDKDLVDNAFTEEQREWCRAWRERPAPEGWSQEAFERDPYPTVPEVSRSEQTTLF